jgi:hypothetical protein
MTQINEIKSELNFPESEKSIVMFDCDDPQDSLNKLIEILKYTTQAHMVNVYTKELVQIF